MLDSKENKRDFSWLLNWKFWALFIVPFVFGVAVLLETAGLCRYDFGLAAASHISCVKGFGFFAELARLYFTYGVAIGGSIGGLVGLGVFFAIIPLYAALMWGYFILRLVSSLLGISFSSGKSEEADHKESVQDFLVQQDKKNSKK